MRQTNILFYILVQSNISTYSGETQCIKEIKSSARKAQQSLTSMELDVRLEGTFAAEVLAALHAGMRPFQEVHRQLVQC